jgi:hypothetical protein
LAAKPSTAKPRASWALHSNWPTRLLREIGSDYANAMIANRIIELAKAGERNPDLLCERALDNLRSRQLWIARKTDAM